MARFTIRVAIIVLIYYGFMQGAKFFTLKGGPVNLARNVKTAMDLRQIVTSIEMNKYLTNQYPDPNHFSEFLEQNMESKIRQDVTLDPWGTPYAFMLRRRDYCVASAGPDREWGTDDDLTAVQDIEAGEAREDLSQRVRKEIPPQKINRFRR